MLAAMTHPNRVLNLDMKAKLIYIFFLLLFGSKPLGNIHNDGRLASLGCEMFINK